MSDYALNVFEMAKDLDVHYQTIYHLAKNNKIPCIRIGRQYRFDRELVRKHLSNLDVIGVIPNRSSKN